MGTDIHGWLQRQRYTGEEWENICAVPGDRNYLLFAALADVRNGYGFAGVRTFDPIQPICKPRGLPDDIKATYEASDDNFTYGEHSQTWFTLKELLDWPGWQQQVRQAGFVERAEYEACIAESRTPQSWCGGISGGDVIKTTVQEINDGVAPADWNYVLMEWSDGALIDRCEPFKSWLAWLRAQYGWSLDHNNALGMRLVIGFDS